MNLGIKYNDYHFFALEVFHDHENSHITVNDRVDGLILVE